MRPLRERAPELGRLRGGVQNDKGQPTSIDHWRATSADQDRLNVLGGLYGIRTKVKPWKDQFEIELDTDTIKVLIPGDPLFVAYELWGSGGCQRRCDGMVASVPITTPDGGHMEQVDCVCDALGLDPNDKESCSPTARLKVVIPEVPGIGIWVMTTGSVFACQELQGQINILNQIGPSGAIWADLVLEPREIKRPWEKFTRTFNVPILRIRDSLQALLQGSGSPALTTGGDEGTGVPGAAAAVGTGQPVAPPEPPQKAPARGGKYKDGEEPF